jgi:hypothetical protein
MRRVRNRAERKHTHLKLQGTTGTAAVEMAAVLPLLVLIVVTIIDLGLVLREHQILQNAAREGARFSALPLNQVGPMNPSASMAAIRQRVTDYLAQEKVTAPANSMTVNQQFPISIAGSTVYGSEVTITYQRALLVSGFFPVGQVTLTGRSVFRNLY